MPLIPASTATRAVGEAAGEIVGRLAAVSHETRATRAELTAAWQGDAAAAVLARVDELLEHGSAMARLAGEISTQALPLAESLARAEQAGRLIAALDAVAAVATVASLVQLGLDPVADALAVGLTTSVAVAREAAREVLTALVSREVRRVVLASGLRRFAGRWAVATVAVPTWRLAEALTVTVVTGDPAPVGDALPAGTDVVGALAVAALPLPGVGRRGFTVTRGSTVLRIEPHLPERHLLRDPELPMRRVLGQVPGLRPVRTATGFTSARGLRRTLDALLAGHAPAVERFFAEHPGEQMTVTVAVPAGVGVAGATRTADGVRALRPEELTTATFVLRNGCRDGHGVLTVMVASVTLGVGPVTPCP